jgi:hypothetical protein
LENHPRRRIATVLAGLASLAILAALGFGWLHSAKLESQTTANVSTSSEPATVATLIDNELANAVRIAVERIVRPKASALALFDDGTKRLACLLVENDAHYYQLDYGLKPENLAALKTGLFQTLPEPIAKATVSRYRSEAKRALGYRKTGEDRLIVLLCPKSEWASLNLTYSGFAPGPLPGNLEPQPTF